MIIISPLVRMVASIATIVLYAVTALSCFGGLIPPSITPIGSVLTIGMPILLTLSLIVTTAWFSFGHWFIGGLGILTFLICINPIRMWFPMQSAPKPTEGATQFTLLTWNILHGADLEKPDYDGLRTIEEILKIDADIVCLQEFTQDDVKEMVSSHKVTMEKLLESYPYQLGLNASYDITILSKYPLRHVYFGSAYKYILSEYCVVSLPKHNIALGNIHLPSFALDEKEKSIFTPRGSMEQKEALTSRIYAKLKYAIPVRAEAAEKVIGGLTQLSMPTIICGDFNDVPASWTYRLFLKAGFKDAYCATNLFPTYTFYPHGFYFHLDQMLYCGDITPLSVDRLNIRTSDHLPLLATFEIPSNQ